MTFNIREYDFGQRTRMAQKELILKDNYICRKALMQNHDLEIQDINGEVTMIAGDPEKADNTRVGTVFIFIPALS